MIRFFYYLGLFLLFFLIQTSNLWVFSVLSQWFDLLLVIVISLSLKFSHIRTVVAVFMLGVAMDSVSGGPFGLYISAYVWIYILIRSLKSLIHLENIVFLVCMGAVAVVVENFFILFVLLMGKGVDAVYFTDLVIMGKQAAWGLILVPLLVLAVDVLEQKVSVTAKRAAQQHFDRG